MKTICPGSLVYWRSKPFVVRELKGLTEAIVRSVENETTELVRVSDLTLSPVVDRPLKAPHVLAGDQEWDVALKRFELIKSLLVDGRKDADEVSKVAIAAGKSVATIYRWINSFKRTGLVSSLLRPNRSDKGLCRLGDDVEQVVKSQIESFYLVKERPSVLQLCMSIERECRTLGLKPPHRNTIYARVKKIGDYEVVKRRLGPKVARDKFIPLRGGFPGADYPNAVVQIDHTPVDVIVVDDQHRQAIGRPYLTLAIDVATRMVTGFRMTLDPPGASSAALCIAHAVLKKDHWLAKRDIHAEWPIYGKMNKIHVDNAKEFRGKALIRGCAQHGITLEYRPKGQPNYGPHIERAFRTFMSETHRLKGTTFSNVSDKLEYNSEGMACLTLDELDLWFTVYIVFVYHNDRHSGIEDVPPIKLYSQFVYGSSARPGVGLPEAIENEENFRLDFTPYFERTVQRSGVILDKINYYAPVLRGRINEKDKETGKGRLFVFVRDPRDISVLYFLDPDDHVYYPVPYFNGSRPPMSVWELREVKKRLKNNQDNVVDEEKIFEGYEKMREIEKTAIEKTRLTTGKRAAEKRRLRLSQRRRGWADVHDKELPAEVMPEPDMNDDDLQPFDEIEIG